MKKKTHRLYALVVIILAVAILTVGILVLFYLQGITVSGNEYCTDQEIADVIKKDKGSFNTIYVTAKYALGYREKLPCLESMKVSMKNPWTLQIKVEEKPIVGYVKDGDRYFYFDKTGLVVDESDSLTEGLPSITGLKMKNVKLYQTLECEDSGIFEEILQTSKEIKKYELGQVQIVCEGNQIFLEIGKVRVSLGNSVSSEQVAQIKPILEKLGDREGTLHLEDYSENGSTITFDVEESQDDISEEK